MGNVSHLLDQAGSIARLIAAQGGRALVVGGYVRDRLVDRPSPDLDIEVFGIPEARLGPLLSTLGRVEAVGQAFAVYKLGDIDIALPRRESKGHHNQRHFVGSGDRRVHRSDEREGRPGATNLARR